MVFLVRSPQVVGIDVGSEWVVLLYASFLLHNAYESAACLQSSVRMSVELSVVFIFFEVLAGVMACGVVLFGRDVEEFVVDMNSGGHVQELSVRSQTTSLSPPTITWSRSSTSSSRAPVGR